MNLETLTVEYGNPSISVMLGEEVRQMMLSSTWDVCGQLVA